MLANDAYEINQSTIQPREIDMYPLYEHDCERCKFVMTNYSNVLRQPFDVYENCETSGTYLFRTGNDGPEYFSSPYYTEPDLDKYIRR